MLSTMRGLTNISVEFGTGEDSMEGKPKRISGSEGLANKVAQFQKRADDHKQKQLHNPFSEWEGASHRPKLSKDDERYGKPVEGSSTDKRGKKAELLISNEMQVLCNVLVEHGEVDDDGNPAILFGDLFQLYTRISSKLVGILMRARKHKFVDFEGEMLYQGRDNDVVVRLIKPIKEIRATYESQFKKPGD